MRTAKFVHAVEQQNSIVFADPLKDKQKIRYYINGAFNFECQTVVYTWYLKVCVLFNGKLIEGTDKMGRLLFDYKFS